MSNSPGASSGAYSASTMSYPSTLSSQTPSSLGLTESPTLVRQLALSRKGLSSPVASPARQSSSEKLAPRPVPKQSSNLSLRQSPSLDSLASSVAQLRLDQRAVPKRPSKLSSSNAINEGSPRAPSVDLVSQRKGETDAHLGTARNTPPSTKQGHRLPRKKVPELDTPQARPDNQASVAPARRSDGRAIAAPSQEQQLLALTDRLVPARGEAGKKTASTPEQEKNVRKARHGSEQEAAVQRPSSTDTSIENRLAKELEARRSRDAEWESFGMWDSQREAARVAEDRTRRDANRAIGE